ITGTNDSPVLDAHSGSLSYTENQAATAIDTVITAFDVDSASLAGATVTITGNFVAGQDFLGFTNQNGITGNYNASTGVLTLTGQATVAQYQAALQLVTYFNSSDNPSSLTRTISYQVNDGSAQNNLSNVATPTVSFTAVDDAPVATITQTTYDAAGSLNLKGTGLSISDVDAGTGSMTVTLSVGEGTLSATAGDSGVVVSGNNSSTLTITGT